MSAFLCQVDLLHIKMSVEEISDGVIQMYTRLFTPDAVLLARIVHHLERFGGILQVFIQLGAVGKQYVVISHAMINHQRAL